MRAIACYKEGPEERSFQIMKTSKASKKAMMLALLLVVSCIDASPASSFSFDMPSENVYSVDHCPPGQKLVEKPEGSFCMKDLSYLWDDGQAQGNSINKVLKCPTLHFYFSSQTCTSHHFPNDCCTCTDNYRAFVGLCLPSC